MGDLVKRSTRPYRAPTRERKAEETRRRIIEAGRRLFRERGYAATTLAEIAKGAGVATPTVYARFGSKLSLLNALIAAATQSPAVEVEIAGFAIQPEPRAQIRLIARMARQIYERSWDVVEILRAAGTADPDAAAAWREADRHARQAQAPFVQALAERGHLRASLDRREAADLVWALSGPDVYRLLVVDSGWSGDRYESWLAITLVFQLLG
jgi:AcrR family transcriptional regulator